MLQQTFLPLQTPPRSLVWQDDVLVDWVMGGNHYHLDGRFEPSGKRYAYRFDGAVALPNGEYAVLFEHLGTKGVITTGKGNVREINRSYYHAHQYHYPVALFNLPDGRPAILHCPEWYNQLEIEIIDTGERITASDSRQPDDFFYSRLEVSPSGRFALSTGWMWHPVDALKVIDLNRVPGDPHHLDDAVLREIDICSAAFLNDQFVIMARTNEGANEDSFGNEIEMSGKCQIEIFDLVEGETVLATGLDLDAVSLLPLDAYYVWDVHKYPKIIHLDSGSVVADCPEIVTQGPVSALSRFSVETHPPYALHPDRRRLAVGTKDGIYIVTFEGG